MGNARRVYGTIAGLALALFMGGAGMTAAQGLPGGATSLNETHNDWTVACRTLEAAVRCAMTQTQVSGENRQRVLAIELTTAEGGNATSGMLVLPFGLQLDSGVMLAIDEDEFLPPLRFSTCLPAGCLVPLGFNGDAVTTLKAGTTLSVKAAANDSAQEVVFSISLTGFTSALNRIAELNALSP